MKTLHVVVTGCLLASTLLVPARVIADDDEQDAGDMLVFRNPSGKLGTFNANGPIDLRRGVQYMV